MTVLRHFGLREQPFGVTPDPRFLYATSTHREALASLLYGLESGLGFVSLIAQPGMGKTTLLFEALRRVADSTRSVFLFQTISNPNELVHSLLMDLGEKDITGNLVEMQSRLNEVLVNHQATGKRLVVVIDEAQNLNTVVLESVRMLSNFETAGQKLLQIVLAGQPQLAEKLVSPELLQLRQRISIFAHLDPLQATEATSYVQHRLRIAGCDLPETVFSKAALASISRASEGIPRNINSICFNALSLGYALQKRAIDADVIEEVLRDLDVRVDYPSVSKLSTPALSTTKVESPNEVTLERAVRVSRPRLWVLCIAGLACIVFSLLVGMKIGGLSGIRGTSEVKQELLGVRNGQQSAPAVAVPAAQTGEEKHDPAPAPVLPALVAPAAVAPMGVAPVTAAPASSTPAPVNVPPVSAVPAPAAPATQLILAHNGQTLYGICKEVFGSCSSDMLHRIVEMNPSIADPNRIRAGKRIVVPLFPSN